MTRIQQIKNAFTHLQSQIGDDPISLALGDYVVYKGQEVECYGTLCKPGEIQFKHLVNKEVNITAISENGMDYGIDGCAWVNRSSLLYVRDADIESLSLIIKMLEDEEEEGEEDGEEDGEDFDEEDESDESDMEVDHAQEPEYRNPSDRGILNLQDGLRPAHTSDLRDQKSLHKSLLAAQDNARKVNK